MALTSPTALKKIAPLALLGMLPILLTIAVAVIASSRHVLAIDFHNELYTQAKDVLHWRNPYPPPQTDLSSGANAIWPIAAVLPLLPLALLPANVADVTLTILELGCLAGTLAILGVRDWRVYGASLLWPSVVNATQTGNATLPLALLCAVAWRYRSSRVTPGLAIGAALGVKFFLWPLVLWLAAIRRLRAAAIAIAIGAASLLLILPFDSIRNYIDLVGNLSRTFDDDSYTLYGLLVESGVSSPVARAVWLTAGAAVLVLAWRKTSLTLFVAASLLLSPIVWLHFFVLLLVPLAIVRPTFGAAWLIPLPMAVGPGTLNGRPWQTAIVLASFAALVVVCVRGERPAGGRNRVAAVEAS